MRNWDPDGKISYLGSGKEKILDPGIRDGKNSDPGIRDGKNSDPGFGMEKIRIRDKHPGSATLVTTLITFVSGAGSGESILAGIGASELPGQAAGGAVGGLDFGSAEPSSRSAKNLTYMQRWAVR
jgi:hypothetical protein